MCFSELDGFSERASRVESSRVELSRVSRVEWVEWFEWVGRVESELIKRIWLSKSGGSGESDELSRLSGSGDSSRFDRFGQIDKFD